MKTLHFVLCAVLALPFGSRVEAGEADGRSARPNILFVVADDLGIGDLRCYGNPYLDTPVIDGLARQGIRFTGYYSPSPLCAPARAGLLTGRYNHRTGAVDVSSNRGVDRIALSERTFGDYFRHAGYATALIGKWHNGLYCNDYLPHNRGFDLFYGFPNGAQDYWKWNLMRNGDYEGVDGRYLTDALNDEAIAFVERNRDRRWAIFLSHHAPHSPYQAPEALIDKYKRLGKGEYSESVAIIYAMIESMDTGLGRVFDALRRLGLWEDTIIVFTSDNGAQLGGSPRGDSCARWHGPYRGNKGMVMEQGIRVPAIVSWPGRIPAARTVETPIHGCDWLPTLFGLTGSKAPAGAKPLDGIDLMPLLGGEEMRGIAGRYLAFQKNRYTPVAHSDACIRGGRWKLYWPGEKSTMAKDGLRDGPSFVRGITHPHWEMPLDPDLPDHAGVKTLPPRLFDLVADPGENRDLAQDRPGLVRAMASVYDRWFEEVRAQWKASNREIREHDRSYWQGREAPDPRSLFGRYWQWKRVGADPAKQDPLEVFTGYWSYSAVRDSSR